MGKMGYILLILKKDDHQGNVLLKYQQKLIVIRKYLKCIC